MTLPQPLSHLAALPQWLEEPLSHSATLPEWLDQPLSHSARVAGAATQPLSHSARVAGAATQPLSHSATLPEWLDEPLRHQPLCQSGWSSHSATQSVAEWLSGWGENFRHCALSRINTLKTQLSKPPKAGEYKKV